MALDVRDAGDARAVDQNIHWPRLLDEFAEAGLNGFQVRYVHAKRSGTVRRRACAQHPAFSNPNRKARP